MSQVTPEQQIEQLSQKMAGMKVRAYDLMEALEAAQLQSKQLTEVLTKVATELKVQPKEDQIQFVDIIERAKTLAAFEPTTPAPVAKDNVVPFPVPPAAPGVPVPPTEA